MDNSIIDDAYGAQADESFDPSNQDQHKVSPFVAVLDAQTPRSVHLPPPTSRTMPNTNIDHDFLSQDLPSTLPRYVFDSSYLNQSFHAQDKCSSLSYIVLPIAAPTRVVQRMRQNLRQDYAVWHTCHATTQQRILVLPRRCRPQEAGAPQKSFVFRCHTPKLNRMLTVKLQLQRRGLGQPPDVLPNVSS